MAEEDLEKELEIAERKAEAMLKEAEKLEKRPETEKYFERPVSNPEPEEPKIEEVLVDTCEDRLSFLRDKGILEDYKKYLKEKKVE